MKSSPVLMYSVLAVALALMACATAPSNGQALAAAAPATAVAAPATPTPAPTVAPTTTVDVSPTGAPSPTAAPAPPTPTAAAISRDLSSMITFSDAKWTTTGQQVKVTVDVANKDKVAHTFNAQANLYRVPSSQLGSDPADHQVTAGWTNLTLGPGEHRIVSITARNSLEAPILAVDFSVSGH